MSNSSNDTEHREQLVSKSGYSDLDDGDVLANLVGGRSTYLGRDNIQRPNTRPMNTHQMSRQTNEQSSNRMSVNQRSVNERSVNGRPVNERSTSVREYPPSEEPDEPLNTGSTRIVQRNNDDPRIIYASNNQEDLFGDVDIDTDVNVEIESNHVQILEENESNLGQRSVTQIPYTTLEDAPALPLQIHLDPNGGIKPKSFNNGVNVKLSVEASYDDVYKVDNNIPKVKGICTFSYSDTIFVAINEEMIYRYPKAEFYRYLQGSASNYTRVYSHVKIATMFSLSNNIYALSNDNILYRLNMDRYHETEWFWIEIMKNVFDFSISRNRDIVWLQHSTTGRYYDKNMNSISKTVPFSLNFRKRLWIGEKTVDFNKTDAKFLYDGKRFTNVFDIISSRDGELLLLREPGRLCIANHTVYRCIASE